MRTFVAIALLTTFTITACKPEPITPPYSLDDPNTRLIDCLDCPNLGFYLNTAFFTNDTPLTFDDRLIVFHGAYCTILEKRIAQEYTWTDETTLEITKLSNVDVIRIECDNRYRRKSDGTTESLESVLKVSLDPIDSPFPQVSATDFTDSHEFSLPGSRPLCSLCPLW